MDVDCAASERRRTAVASGGTMRDVTVGRKVTPRLQKGTNKLYFVNVYRWLYNR